MTSSPNKINYHKIIMSATKKEVHFTSLRSWQQLCCSVRHMRFRETLVFLFVDLDQMYHYGDSQTSRGKRLQLSCKESVFQKASVSSNSLLRRTIN